MPSYSFNVTMTVTNSTDREQSVSIPRGTLIEPDLSHLAYQSAILVKDYIFKLSPRETRSVILEAACWNQHLAPPKGIYGTLTPLRGMIDETTDIWGTSSTPSKATVAIKPAQNAHIFSAFANASPPLAYKFLRGVASTAATHGINVTDIMTQLNAITLPYTNSSQISTIADHAALRPYISATRIREFFIRQGNPANDHIEAVIDLITHIYILTSHDLVTNLKESAMKLWDIYRDRKIAVDDERKRELTTIIYQQYNAILEKLPSLDEIYWTS